MKIMGQYIEEHSRVVISFNEDHGQYTEEYRRVVISFNEDYKMISVYRSWDSILKNIVEW